MGRRSGAPSAATGGSLGAEAADAARRARACRDSQDGREGGVGEVGAFPFPHPGRPTRGAPTRARAWRRGTRSGREALRPCAPATLWAGAIVFLGCLLRGVQWGGTRFLFCVLVSSLFGTRLKVCMYEELDPHEYVDSY